MDNQDLNVKLVLLLLYFEFNVNKYNQTISKSENTKIFGKSHGDDEINAIVHTILTTTNMIIWKERNVANYQKKNLTKLKIIKLIKSEISFIFSLAESKTRKDIFSIYKK